MRKPKTVEAVAPLQAQLLLSLSDIMRHVLPHLGQLTFIGEAKKSTALQRLKSSLKAYSEAVRLEGAGHKNGSPEVWMFLELLEWLQESLKTKGGSHLEDLRYIEKQLEECVQLQETPEKIQTMHVGMIKMQKAYSKKGEQIKFKLQILLKDQRLAKITADMLSEDHCQRKEGVAPRGALERDIQFFLNHSKQ